MAEIAKLERDALFKRLRAKPENKVRECTGCLPCTYGILYLVLRSERALMPHCTKRLVNVPGSED